VRHLFISHCTVSEAFMNATPDDVEKYLAKMKESAKEHGIEIIFWGNPWGVTESFTFVCQSDKSLDNYVTWRGAWSRKTASEGLPVYFTATRTITVTELVTLRGG